MIKRTLLLIATLLAVLLVLPACSTEAPVASCALTTCSGACVDTSSDRAHCGTCDTACASGEVCNGSGVCALSCQAGLLDCGGTCIDPLTDRKFCGAASDCTGANAGVACAPGELCSKGACLAAATSATFVYTGAPETFVVPAGVTSVNVEAWGARGGDGYGSGSNYGRGGYVRATVAVTPGESLTVTVGGVGHDGFMSSTSAGGFNGGGSSVHGGNHLTSGGGGGASDVRRGGTALTDRVVVAGGGGGGPQAGNGERGGDGGGPVGAAGWNGTIGSNPGHGGGGATQSAGGAGGTGGTGADGADGALGVGGAAVASGLGNAGGGGGGGYYGGGGGEETGSPGSPGGGGGGSSYAAPGSTAVLSVRGVVVVAGQVNISW